MAAREVPFTELLSHIVDNRGRTCPTSDSGMPLIATNCVRNDLLYPAYDKVRYVSKDTYANWFRGHPEPGDLIFVCKGSPGRVCLTPDPVGFCIAQDMVAVRADPTKVYPRFLFAALRSDIVQQRIANMHVGTLIPHFKKGDFDKLLVPLPDYGTQTGIGDLYFTLSAMIDLNRRMNATLEGISRAIFKSWFVDFDPVRQKAAGKQPVGMDAQTAALFPDSFEDSEIGEVPKGWGVAEVRDLLSLSRESVDPSEHPAETFDHYSIPAFDSGCWPSPDVGADIKSQKLLVAPGSVLISKLNPRTPRVWIPQARHTRRPVASTEFLVALPNKKTGAGVPFVFCFASSESVVEYLASHASGTSNSHQRVRPDDFLSLRTAIASNAVLGAFDGVVGPLLQRSSRARSESRVLAALRDTLLPKLLSGEIRVPKAEEAVEESVR